MELGIWEILIGSALILNIYVSLFIAIRSDLDHFQKFSQIIIVWLIPFFASIGLWSLNRSHDIKYTGTADSGTGFGGANGHGDSGGGGDG